MVYHERFTKEYGNAFEIHGLLGVSPPSCSQCLRLWIADSMVLQEKQFFISDAHAISVILNNPDTFHETKYV